MAFIGIDKHLKMTNWIFASIRVFFCRGPNLLPLWKMTDLCQDINRVFFILNRLKFPCSIIEFRDLPSMR